MISAVFQRFFGMLPLVLRVAVVTEIAVPTMTYLLMPQMTRLFSWWLYPSTEMTLPTKNDIPAIAENSQAIPLPNLQSPNEEKQQIAISLNP